VIFLSGEDAEAKSDVAALFEDGGFYVFYLGGLREGGRMQHCLRKGPYQMPGTRRLWWRGIRAVLARGAQQCNA
jgi:predicted dinucleotide-binding enzyme